jgi:hypothetical protein
VTRPRDLIAGSALFDERWYAAEAGLGPLDREVAVEHYLAHGRHLSPHALFSPAWVFPDGLPSASSPLRRYLTTPRRFRRAPHPLLHLGRITSEHPDAAEDPLGPADHWLRRATPESVVPTPRGLAAVTWAELARRLAVPAGEAPPAGPQVAGRTTIVLPLLTAPLRSVDWVWGVFREHAGVDLELVLPVAGTVPELRVLRELASSAPRARVLDAGPGGTWAAAADLGLRHASGDTVVFLRQECAVPYSPWVGALREGLEAEGVACVQPLLLAPDHTVATAGASFVSGVRDRTDLLAGHAEQDAQRLGSGPIPAVSRVIALRTDLARELGGFGDTLPDHGAETLLSLRAVQSGAGHAALAAHAELVHPGPVPVPEVPLPDGPPPGSVSAWRRAGYATTATADGVHDVAPLRVHAGPRGLRWTIDLPVTQGAWGRRWGDRYFAESLASALERQGQHVTIDSRASRLRDTRAYDDVVLVLRGQDQVMPRLSPTHVLWVISHPDDVTAEEAAAFDLVFAASETWSRERSLAWGTPVRPLLQCTDPERFHPGRGVPDRGAELLFVGNAREPMRPAVAAALRAGWRPTIYGNGWADVVDPALVAAAHVGNDQIGTLYAEAGVVLNDHLDGMRRSGFVSNRVFDAVACGARVLTDEIAGPADAFEGSVLTFGDASWPWPDVRALRAEFGDQEQRRRNAERVLAEHTFDRRAETLVEAVSRRRSAQA